MIYIVKIIKKIKSFLAVLLKIQFQVIDFFKCTKISYRRETPCKNAPRANHIIHALDASWPPEVPLYGVVVMALCVLCVDVRLSLYMCL